MDELLQPLAHSKMAIYVVIWRPSGNAAQPHQDVPHDGVDGCAVDSSPTGDGIQLDIASAREHRSLAYVVRCVT